MVSLEALLLLLIFALLLLDTVLIAVALAAAWKLFSEVQELKGRLVGLLDALGRDASGALREYAGLARDVRDLLGGIGAALGSRALQAVKGPGAARGVATAAGVVAGLRAARRLYEALAGLRRKPGAGTPGGSGATTRSDPPGT